MKEDIILFKTSVLAKEKGFPQDLFNTSWYNELGREHGRTDINKEGKTFAEVYPDEPYRFPIKDEHKAEFNIESYTAPTQSLLQKWLREKHTIYVVPCPSSHNNKVMCEVYHFTAKNPTGYTTIEGLIGDSWEEVLEKGLFEALKLVKHE